jgi:ribonuclease HI
MPWVRRRYRGNKVWVETDAAEAYVLDERGLAHLRYKPEDDRTYSVRPKELTPVEDAPPPPAAALEPDVPPGDAATAPAAPKRRAPHASAPRAVAAVAPTDAEDLDVPALLGKELQVWTDGASSGNPGPSGAGAVLLFRDRKKEVAVFLGDTTNNVAELTAVRTALQQVRKRDLPVRVMTDSTYVIGVLTGAMKAKANAALIASIRAELAEFPDLAFVKVEAHAGVPWNERADALARDAITQRRSSVREGTIAS